MHLADISQIFLHSVLDYDPETGVFTWIKSRQGTKAGARAGYIEGSGYRQIMILGVAYRAARLAWLYVTGEWPKDQIDHIDHDRLNDRIENLREATGSTNCINRRKRAGCWSKYSGVTKHGNRWQASVKRDGLRTHLGTFDTDVEAAKAYDAAARQLFGEYANLNFKN